MRRILVLIIAAIILLFAGIQLIPYGHDHNNPDVVAEPQWNDQSTRDLAVRACYDCHSNETTWPWYADLAPVSWLVQRDVQEGRRALNFSDWGTSGRRAFEAAEVVLEGEMPPVYYTWMHSSAKLTDAERQSLAQGLQNSLK
ncbi:MAG: heme-binding domain-containing protein [Anaerolineales bacterium]